MTSGAALPQLYMVRRDLRRLPDLKVADGYRLRTYEPGDARHWVNIIAGSFKADPAALSFDKTMRQDPAFRPERIFFICREDEPVGTTAAYIRPVFWPNAGMIHFVGVLEGHGGKGLGQALMLAALRRMHAEGRTAAWLSTDDFRLAAIKLYLSLGFEPLLLHESHRSRWPAVLTTLNRLDLVEAWKDVWTAPLWVPPAPMNDVCNYAERMVPRKRWHAGRSVGTLKIDDVTGRSDESIYRPSRLGRAGTDCPEVRVMENKSFRLWFEAGPDSVGVGGEVRFYTPGQNPLGSPTQIKQADQPGYVEIEQAPPTVRLETLGVGFRVCEGLLRAGERVTLRIGRENGFAWTPLAGRKDIQVVVDPGAGEPKRRLPEPIVIRVLPDEGSRIEVLLPGTARPGQPVSATLTVRDRFDNRVPWSGPLQLRVAGRVVPFYVVEGWGRGWIANQENTVLQGEALMPGSGLRGVSNPCRPSESQQLYFGDLHSHDSTSEAEGYMPEAFLWARDEKRLDFLSQSVQCHHFVDNEKWYLARQMAEMFLDEGRFVTLLAFEWQHSQFGDKIVHYLGGDAPYLPVDDPRYSQPAALYEAVRGSDAFIISHHPGYAVAKWVPGTDFSRMETDVDRGLELWSMHGSSEGYDPADRPLHGPRREGGVMEALRQGVRVALLAGSDTHASRPGGSSKEPCGYWGGLCAVWAENLTRRGLFEAFRSRRTYALTGARIGLKFTINGAPMGQEIPFTEELRIHIEVWAPDHIQRVEILKNTRVWKNLEPSGSEAMIEERDRIETPAFYHCRVTLKNGHLAVCTPVWVG